MADIAFEIGAIVIPVNNLTAPTGEEILTLGITGTVIDRSYIYSNPEISRDYYDYQVELMQPVALPSGASDTGFGSIFWFSEEDLGNTGPFSDIIIVDAEAESSKFNEGTVKVDQSVQTIDQILTDMDPTSYYYDVVKSYLEIMQTHKDAMSNYSDTFSDQNSIERNAKAAGKQGDVLGFDGDVFTELAQNALGYHDIFKMIDAEFKSIEDQVKLQNTLALEDDEENFRSYYTIVAAGNQEQNVLVPGNTTGNTDYTEAHRAEKQEFEDLLTVSGLLGEIVFPTGSE